MDTPTEFRILDQHISGCALQIMLDGAAGDCVPGSIVVGPYGPDAPRGSLLTIYLDGRIELGEGVTALDEASRTIWHGLRLLCDQVGPVINQARENAEKLA